MIPIVIVGHVDHGKSTFIGRLLYDTGTLSPEKYQDILRISKESGQKMEFAHVTDQFQEERDANITMDTSQIFFHWKEKAYVLIDAPGHKEYLKNMITGATQAENAIVLVDIQEGIQEQTKKHLRILHLLNIKNVLFLINKMDSVRYSQERFRSLEKSLRILGEDSGFPHLLIIPISAYEGENIVKKSEKMDWYKGPTAVNFLENCQSLENSKENGAFRFPVQTLHEAQNETWILGRIEQGGIKTEDKIQIFPLGTEATVKKIEKWNTSLTNASTGDSIALLIEPAVPLLRGHVLCSGSTSIPSTILLQSFWASDISCVVGEMVRLECRTQSVSAEVKEIRDILTDHPLDKLQNGDLAFLLLQPKAPILLENNNAQAPFSRVVLQKEGQVVGCGVVMDLSNE